VDGRAGEASPNTAPTSPIRIRPPRERPGERCCPSRGAGRSGCKARAMLLREPDSGEPAAAHLHQQAVTDADVGVLGGPRAVEADAPLADQPPGLAVRVGEPEL